MIKNTILLILIGLAQILAWFQSNSALITGWIADNYLLTAIALSPIVSVLFAYVTKEMYQSGWTLWSIRFIAFGIGYIVFTPLTWYFLNENIFTLKNIMSFILCVLLIYLQVIMK
jgi:MFS family permease